MHKYVLILLVLVMIDFCLQGSFVHEEDFNKNTYHHTKMLLSVSREEVEKELTNFISCVIQDHLRIWVFMRSLLYLHILIFFFPDEHFSIFFSH